MTLSAFLLLTALVISPISTAAAGVITGTVYDFDSKSPIPFATVRNELTGQSIPANSNGEYRLRLPGGACKLKFSHLAHYSEWVEINVTDSPVVRDVYLRSSRIEVEGIKVYARALGPGQRIIVEAIKRKDEILSKVRSYSFDSYTKVVIRDEGADDSSSIRYIVETQTQSYWEQPDKYKEIVTARKVSRNITDTDAFVTVGELLNFDQNRIEVGDASVVSPTAEDALDHYNYYLLDTIYVDGKAVFRLEIEPRNQTDPLLTGEILIADSTYNVVGVDGGFNEGFDEPYLIDPHFSQKYAPFENDIWMPVEIRFDCDLDIPIPGVPRFFIDYVAIPHSYSINLIHPEDRFDEYSIEIAEGVDEVDSVKWNSGQLVPLTLEEVGAYSRIDSIAEAPKPLHTYAVMAGVGAMYMTFAPNDFFHFNRVEGTYLGAGFNLKDLIPRTELRLKSGYAFSGDYWQHDYGISCRLHDKRKLRLHLGYHDLITKRPTMISSPGANQTFLAAMFKSDPFDYYLNRGWDIGLSFRPLKHTNMKVTYHDQNHYSVPKNTEFCVFDTDEKHRENPEIDDGKMRFVSSELTIDSRKLMKIGSEETPEFSPSYTTIKLGLEIASPDLIDNDSDFRRYHIRLMRRQNFPGLGTTCISGYLGGSDGSLPPQQYYSVDFGASIVVDDVYFKTLYDENYSGSRVASIYLCHDFGTRLFKKSGIPLVKRIPFSLALFGGAFWTDSHDHDYFPGDEKLLIAKKPYTEIGFQIGRITPWNLKFDFAFQLSNYDTKDFTFSFGGFLFD